MIYTDSIEVSGTPSGVYLLSQDNALADRLMNSLTLQTGLQIMPTHPLALLSQLEQPDHGVLLVIADSASTDGSDNELLAALESGRIPLISLLEDPVAAPAPVSANLIGAVDPAQPDAFGQVRSLVSQVVVNHRTRIIVLHENDGQRGYLLELLGGHYYTAHGARDAAEAIELLSLYPQTTLLLLSEQARSSGELDVISTIRERHGCDELAILGLTRKRDPALLAAMLDAGANDVVPTSTDDVELLARVRGLTRQVETASALRRRVYHDLLSGAYTEDYFRDVGQKIFANAQRGNLQFSLAVLNIDGLRAINEQYGADIGDGVLAGVVRLVREQLRETDFVARLQGDEFVCVASYVGRRNVRRVFERVTAAVSGHGVWVGNVHLPVSLSIGATAEIGASLEAMLSRAGLALAQARKSGAGGLEVL
ncbi:diguanylate cyclase [Granulosicoccaceae sp. 1_MG-2023]|nr:diguanylate cyclase [Granulosicoccaceae sp. 1_MG-2023]